MESTENGKVTRSKDDVIGDVFFGTFVYIGIGLVVIAAVIGLIVDPTSEAYDAAYSISEYIPLPAEMLARVLFGIALGFLTAIACVVLWFIMLVAFGLLFNRFGSPEPPDHSLLPEPSKIEQGLLERLQQEGISQEDAKLFILTRRACLNSWTRGRMGELFTRMNVETQGVRVDLVNMGIDTGFVPGQGEKKFWILRGVIVFVPVVRPETIQLIQRSVSSLGDAMRRMVPEVSEQIGVWDVMMPGEVSFTFIGARAEFDQLKAGPAVYSLLDRRMLPAHGSKVKTPTLAGIEFEQIGKLRSGRVRPAGTAVEESEAGMTFCTQCGTRNENSFRFCIKCGQTLKTASD